ncbi:MAG TPA: hypothetical protein VFF69_13700 [Phycisphaerales bacterium]|nr:hypothetical protein [Phycisphaerales bacterium]
MRNSPIAALLMPLMAGALVSCSGGGDRDGRAGAKDAPEATALRLVLSNTTPEAEVRQTTVDLGLPEGWRSAGEFGGAWTQPEGAPTLMLVASGFDDGRRAGAYEARRGDAGRISIDLHPAYADNNVTLEFTMMSDADGSGRWGHSTFAGFREKGPVEASLTEP